jgi:two-component system, OmpR family, KDP operon response regulator KdpE
MKAVFIGVSPRTAEIASISVRLRWPDAAFLTAPTAAQGLELVEQEWPNIVLLHPDFSDLPHSRAIQDLRGFSNVPLLVLAQQGDEMEAVSSLELGADDYVRLPCDLTELTARIWALLRRAGGAIAHERESPLLSGRLLVNPATYEAFLGRERLALTTTEFRLLYLLVKNWGIVVARQTLERTLWGEQTDSYGLVKRYVQRLRHKLGDDAHEPRWVASIHGVGYQFIGPTPRPVEAADYTGIIEDPGPVGNSAGSEPFDPSAMLSTGSDQDRPLYFI